MTAAQIREEGLVLLLAAAQDHQLDAAVHQAIGHALHQVKALHAYHTADHAKHGAAVLMETEPLLQRLFADGLAFLNILDAVIDRNVLIGSGVVCIHIDAVQDAAELILLLPQQRIQTIAEPGVQDTPAHRWG